MIRKIIYAFIVNIVAFLAAGYFIAGFNVAGNIVAFLILVALFTAINLFIRPIIRLVLSPLIFLTLGLFSLVINAGILYLVDIYSENITISGLLPLVYGTLIITGINFLLHVPEKLFGK